MPYTPICQQWQRNAGHSYTTPTTSNLRLESSTTVLSKELPYLIQTQFGQKSQNCTNINTTRRLRQILVTRRHLKQLFYIVRQHQVPIHNDGVCDLVLFHYYFFRVRPYLTARSDNRTMRLHRFRILALLRTYRVVAVWLFFPYLIGSVSDWLLQVMTSSTLYIY